MFRRNPTETGQGLAQIRRRLVVDVVGRRPLSPSLTALFRGNLQGIVVSLQRSDSVLTGRGTRGIASHNDDVHDSTRTNIYNIPEGARLRLKRSVDVLGRAATLSSTASQRACKIIGKALKTYGAYVVDTAGAPTFYAENLQGKSVSWTGLLDPKDSSPFLASDFEVLTLPPLTSSLLR
jgi:hypothetical protein